MCSRSKGIGSADISASTYDNIRTLQRGFTVLRTGKITPHKRSRATARLSRPSKDGFDTPTGATRVGNVVWVSEVQFGFLFDPAKKGQKPAPFRIYPVPVK